MLTPTPQPTEQTERAIVQTLIDFMVRRGVWKEASYGKTIRFRQVSDGRLQHIEPFIRSLDSLRLAEKELAPRQWTQYAEKLDQIISKADTEIIYNSASSMCGIKHVMQLPVSIRAAALAEVVGR